MKATFHTETGSIEYEGTPEELAALTHLLSERVKAGPTGTVAGPIHKKRVRTDHARTHYRRYTDQERRDRLRIMLEYIRRSGRPCTGTQVAEGAGFGTAMALGQVKKDLVQFAEDNAMSLSDVVSISGTVPKFYAAGPQIGRAISILTDTLVQQVPLTQVS